MGVLIQVGFKQIKNYIKYNKFKCFLVSAFILLMAAPYALTLFSGSNLIEYNMSKPVIGLFPLSLLVSAAFIALSFINAETLMISRAEANIFFVSPIKEQHIMSYVILKSSYQVLLILVLFTSFNINFMIPYYRVETSRSIFLLLWEFLILITYLYLGTFLFILKKRNIKLFYSIIGFLIAAAGIAAALFLSGLKSYYDIWGELNIFLSKPVWGYIPVIGWLANITKLFHGFDLGAVISLILLLILNAAFFFAPQYIKTSLAEAAIDASEKYHKRIQRQKKGNKIEIKTKEIKTSSTVMGAGWTAIIGKQWIDYKRSSRFFVSGAILTQMMIMAVYVVIYKLSAKDMSAEFAGNHSVMTVLSLFFILVIALISIMMPSDISKDVNHPLIMLIPEKPYKKLLAVSVMSNFENLVKMVLIAVFSFLMDIDIVTSIFIALTFFLGVSTASYVDMFFNSILKDNILYLFRAMFGSVTKMIILFIYTAVYGSLAYLLTIEKGFSLICVPALLAVFAIAALIDFVLILASQSVMNNIEK